jgi:Holliday junction resolvasome RuvABC endonuclease subunit
MATLVLNVKGRKLGLDESDALAVAYCHGVTCR